MPDVFALTPPQASNFAPLVDWLYTFLALLTGGASLTVAVLIIAFAIRYRRRSPDQLAAPTAGSVPLEVGWTLALVVLLIVPFVWGASLYMEMARPPAGALEIGVLAKQWMWKAQHPDGQREIDELHVPVGRPVKLTMISQDVIHSFFVPAFRVKADLLPGRYTTVWFTPTRPGRYPLFCAEYCGLNHSRMRGEIVVVEPTAYQAWLAGIAGAPSLSPASEGEKLVAELGCTACHRDDSLRRAPPFTGLFGAPVRLLTGETVVADETYLRESILNPAARIVMGYQPIMPPYEGRVTEEQLLALIAYIKSLAPAVRPDRRAGEVAPSPR